MIEPKISLSLLVPGACMLSQQAAENKPQESYDKHSMLICYTKGKGKHQKLVKEKLTFNTRKSRLVTQNINICEEAYNYMLSTPTSQKLAKPLKVNKSGDVIKRVWDTLNVHERLKHHFDLIAHDLGAVSYSYEILGD